MKILVVLSRFPYPLEKGDKLRAYHQIRCLSEKHEIYLAAVCEQSVSSSDFQQLKPYCKDILLMPQGVASRLYNLSVAFFKGLPIQCGYFYSKRNQRLLDEFVRGVAPDRIYCQLFRMAEYVKSYAIHKTIDYQDVFSKGMLRRYEKAPCYQKPFFRMEHRRVARYETEIFDYFDGKTIITAVDRDLIPHENKGNISVIANGVDFQKFNYCGETKEYDIIFSGNMSYAPNVDAAEYLVKGIMPQLWAEFPDLRVVLCGATPADRVKALASNKVIVTGWVNSMVEWYAKSKVFVAPMRMGTGLQNKLLEAMAMQLPCVTSPLAGKPLHNAEKERAIVTSATTIGYVEAVRRLLTDDGYYHCLAENGNRFVHENYDWDTSVAQLEQIITAE